MRLLRGVGLIIFIFGAIVAILDLLDMIKLGSNDNPFYGALALMVAGICLTFFSQSNEGD